MIFAESGVETVLVLIYAVIGISVAGLMASGGACFYAWAAKLRAEYLALNLVRDRELTRQRTDKLDQVAEQTDGMLSKLMAENKALRTDLAEVKASLASVLEQAISHRGPTDIKA